MQIAPPAGSADPAWLVLRLALWPDTAEAAHLSGMADAIARGHYVRLAVATDGSVLGFVEASKRVDYVNGTNSSPVAFLEGLYVVPSVRRRGVARTLVASVVQWALEEGCTELASDALLDNCSAHAVHRSLGFEETERVVYFRRALRDAAPLGRTVRAALSLDTSRLRLRQFAEADLDDYAALCADAEVMRYVSDRGPLSREDAWRQLAMLVGHWALRGYGMWAVEELGSGAFVGRVGLHYPEGWPEPEIGWALARGFWGRGYAFEAATAALHTAFTTLNWPRVVSLIAPANLRSIRLAERLGAHFERNIVVRGHEVSLYAVEHEQ